MESNYKLLLTKEIMEILDGDIVIEEKEDIQISMPYLSGPALCDLSQKFGLPEEYKWGKGAVNKSRWQYLYNLVEYTISKNNVSELLSYLFGKENFSNKLRGLKSVDKIEETHKYIVNSVINKINSQLYFGGHKIDIIANKFIVVDTKEEIKIDTPNIKVIDREYIKNLTERAIKDIDENNYDSAITKSRTILEETFIYTIEKKNVELDESGEIGKLYKQVKDLYNMHTDKNMDKRINKLLSGLENIVQALAEMRNNGSDSHGLGNKRIGISSYHARLAVNASSTMADFILSVSQENK